jgi:hypothetical protein
MPRPWLAVAVAAGATGLLFAAVGTASVLPRFYSTKPNAALARFEKSLNRTISSTNAKCSLHDGNTHAGWRRIGCNATTHNPAGTPYDVRIVAIPRSCTRIRETVTVFGADHYKQTVAWHHTFSCKT